MAWSFLGRFDRSSLIQLTAPSFMSASAQNKRCTTKERRLQPLHQFSQWQEAKTYLLGKASDGKYKTRLGQRIQPPRTDGMMANAAAEKVTVVLPRAVTVVTAYSDSANEVPLQASLSGNSVGIRNFALLEHAETGTGAQDARPGLSAYNDRFDAASMLRGLSQQSTLHCLPSH
ncbi:hypothetical protein LZ32DRAFT_318926 [Colletotrichum eremochloae]|nr:hypothetical protein LZ32DRAFT_318926 [Colletotrichum eremochloae]